MGDPHLEAERTVSTKIIAGNDGCTSLDIAGAVLRRDKGGFTVPDKHARQLAQAIGGAVCGTRPLANAPARWCAPCGFRTPFTTCGRCGRPTQPEE